MDSDFKFYSGQHVRETCIRKETVIESIFNLLAKQSDIKRKKENSLIVIYNRKIVIM